MNTNPTPDRSHPDPLAVWAIHEQVRALTLCGIGIPRSADGQADPPPGLQDEDRQLFWLTLLEDMGRADPQQPQRPQQPGIVLIRPLDAGPADRQWAERAAPLMTQLARRLETLMSPELKVEQLGLERSGHQTMFNFMLGSGAGDVALKKELQPQLGIFEVMASVADSGRLGKRFASLGHPALGQDVLLVGFFRPEQLERLRDLTGLDFVWWDERPMGSPRS